MQFIALLGMFAFSSCANNGNRDSVEDSQEIEAEKQMHEQERLQYEEEDE